MMLTHASGQVHHALTSGNCEHGVSFRSRAEHDLKSQVGLMVMAKCVTDGQIQLQIVILEILNN